MPKESAGARKEQPRGRSPVTALQLAAGMAIFGSATPVSRIVAGAMPIFVGSLLRVALGALVLSPAVFRHRHQLRTLDRRDWLLIGVISLFGMVGFTAFMLYGMRMVPGVVGATVMSTTPAVMAAASMIFLRERATWRKLAAIALAVVGVLVLHVGGGGNGSGGSGEGHDLILGSLLVFAAVCCEVVYSLVGKKASERADPILVACLAAALSLPLFLPLAAWQWRVRHRRRGCRSVARGRLVRRRHPRPRHLALVHGHRQGRRRGRGRLHGRHAGLGADPVLRAAGGGVPLGPSGRLRRRLRGRAAHVVGARSDDAALTPPALAPGTTSSIHAAMRSPAP